MSQLLRIVAVETPKEFDAFYRLPWSIYKSDPNWVPPLLMELKERLDPKKNPFFQHARAKYWLACRGGKAVGRISAQIDDLGIEHLGEKIGNFGFFECENDAEAAKALLNTAEDWLRAEGMTKIYGPYSPTLNEEPGILVDGFDAPPMMLMAHSRDYYSTLVESAGYAKVKDLYAYYRDIRLPFLPEAVKRLMSKVQASGRIKLRRIDMSKYDRDLAIILDIFNDAWTDNWGYVPMTEAELKHTAQGLKLLIREDYVYIAELEGEPVGMMVTLPNLNEIIARINGSLLPFGWIKFLKWLKIGPHRTTRVPLMGVRRSIQNKPTGAVIAFMLIEAIRDNAARQGATHAELSWILEDNMRMRGMLETVGCDRYKTYRIYGKSLDQ
jgi:GNAT superfamily N-acetyltransferase